MRLYQKGLGLALLVCCGSCRPSANVLPDPLPTIAGRVTQRSFSRDSVAWGGLYLFAVRRDVHMPSAVSAEEGYFRVDSLTRWVLMRGRKLDWDITGVPNLARAKVRVWMRGEPSSLTPTELWARADVVLIDSLGR